jgi:hypothetical protein
MIRRIIIFFFSTYIIFFVVKWLKILFTYVFVKYYLANFTSISYSTDYFFIMCKSVYVKKFKITNLYWNYNFKIQTLKEFNSLIPKKICQLAFCFCCGPCISWPCCVFCFLCLWNFYFPASCCNLVTILTFLPLQILLVFRCGG